MWSASLSFLPELGEFVLGVECIVAPSVEVAFVDAEGVTWVRRATGLLQKLPEEPFASEVNG
jgi:hypothetical protein